MKYGMYSNIECFCCIRYLLFQQHINIILIHTSVYVVFDFSSLPPVFSRFNYAAAFTCTLHCSFYKHVHRASASEDDSCFRFFLFHYFLFLYSPQFYVLFSSICLLSLLPSILITRLLLIGIFILMVTMVLNCVLLTIS